MKLHYKKIATHVRVGGLPNGWHVKTEDNKIARTSGGNFGM